MKAPAIHEIDFNLVLTLGPRMGPVIEAYHKYKDLEIEIERMWGMKATTIPVVIGALGFIKKGIHKDQKHIQTIPGSIRIHQLQKIRVHSLGRPTS